MSKHSAGGARWNAQRKRVLDRDGWTCAYCGTHLEGSDATVDHISPISHNPGREYRDSELLAACRRCNGRRQDAPMRRLDYANPRWLPGGLPGRDATALQVRPEVTVPPPELSDHGRIVVLLCGPAGAGKTTAARASGLQLYDRDEPQWTSEAHFRRAIAALNGNPNARAVVIRSGATSSARAKAAALIGATHVRVMLGTAEELGHRVAHRNRADVRHGLASIKTWLAKFERNDGVPDFTGWDPETREPL